MPRGNMAPRSRRPFGGKPRPVVDKRTDYFPRPHPGPPRRRPCPVRTQRHHLHLLHRRGQRCKCRGTADHLEWR